MSLLLPGALELLMGSTVDLSQAKGVLPDLERLGWPTIFSAFPSASLMNSLKKKGYTHLRRFIVLPSRHMPRWLLPDGRSGGTLAGTQIYLPQKWLPRTIKKLVVQMIRRGWDRWPHSEVLVASKGPVPFELLTTAITHERNPIFALSLARRLAVRKLTVQVMRPNGEILGYVKLPLARAATERVRHEAKVLEKLWTFPELRPHIPQLFHAGNWGDSYLLFQSALPGEVGPASLTELHQNFLHTLGSVNRIDRSGQSVVEEIGAKWDKAVVLLDSKWKELGREVLQRSARDLDGQTLRCGISHGDFAPWNSRVHNQMLLLFDWESTQWEAPSSWDVFHFSLQTAISFNRQIGNIIPAQQSGRPSYLLYLLSSVIQFRQEENWAAIDYRQKLLRSELEKTIHIGDHERTPPRPQAIQVIDRRVGASQRVSNSVSKIVTTSWDDGDPRDLRIAELLHSRELAGTFYIPLAGYLNNSTLAGGDVRALSAGGFEIGAHSISHNSLTLLSKEQMKTEVKSCKQTLEQIVGKEVSMFCYPNGRYNPCVIQEVMRAGYQGARTTWMLSTSCDFRHFEMPTTLQAFPHPATGYLRDLGRARDFPGLWKFTTELSRLDSWVDLGMKLFSQVLEHGGIWHLYGHSWEIDDLAIWSDLRKMLDHVSHHEDVTYATNGELISLLKTNAGTNPRPPTGNFSDRRSMAISK